MAGEDDEGVPKLPRGRGIKLSGPEIFRIALTAGMLIAILVLAKPCSDAVSRFVMRFDNGSAKAAEMPHPGQPAPAVTAGSQHYELITPDMTDAEKRAAIDRARRAAAGSGQ
jgi:hypothetical protein